MVRLGKRMSGSLKEVRLASVGRVDGVRGLAVSHRAGACSVMVKVPAMRFEKCGA